MIQLSEKYLCILYRSIPSAIRHHLQALKALNIPSSLQFRSWIKNYIWSHILSIQEVIFCFLKCLLLILCLLETGELMRRCGANPKKYYICNEDSDKVETALIVTPDIVDAVKKTQPDFTVKEAAMVYLAAERVCEYVFDILIYIINCSLMIQQKLNLLVELLLIANEFLSRLLKIPKF